MLNKLSGAEPHSIFPFIYSVPQLLVNKPKFITVVQKNNRKYFNNNFLEFCLIRPLLAERGKQCTSEKRKVFYVYISMKFNDTLYL